MTNILAMGDTHIPYQCDWVVELMFKFITAWQPHIIVLGGDMIDFYSLSKFSKDPRRALEVQDDLDELIKFFERLREVAPDAKIIYLKGNHENRLRTYKFTKAPEMAYLRCLAPETMFQLEDFDIEWMEKRWIYGEICFEHGHKISKHSGYTAKAIREDNGMSTIHHHTHRTGKSNRTDLTGNKGGWESGCLCSLDPEYMSGPVNWQHGFSTVRCYKDIIFHVDNIDIVKKSFLFEGDLFTVNQEYEKNFKENTREENKTNMANMVMTEYCPECQAEGINVKLRPDGSCSYCPVCGHSKCK